MTDTSNAPRYLYGGPFIIESQDDSLCDWSAVNMPGRDLCGCVAESDSGTGGVLCVACQLTDAEIAADLAALSETECAARGIRHSSADDNSTAILDTNPDWLTRGMLGAAARKVGL